MDRFIPEGSCAIVVRVVQQVDGIWRSGVPLVNGPLEGCRARHRKPAFAAVDIRGR
jgi:hypothetical protein